MDNMDTARVPDVPSARRLLRSTLIAAAVAVFLLVTTVLPAEYGVDPTGIGRVLGLTEMGEIKVALAKEAAGHDSAETASTAPSIASPAAPAGVAPAPESAAVAPATKSDVTEIVLLPTVGKEIKLVMRKGARVNYSWTTNSGVVNYDTHGDAPTIDYHGYGKGTGKATDEGVLTAAFDGSHGWFWRNRTSSPITVTLRTTGDYQELKRMQ